MKSSKILIILAVIFCVIVNPVSAGSFDDLDIKYQIKDLTKPSSNNLNPSEIFSGSKLNSIEYNDFDRRLINALPDQAMEYNTISAFEELIKFQEAGLNLISLNPGNIPGKSLTLIDGLMEIPKLELNKMKFNTITPKFYDMEYKFKDIGINGITKIKLNEVWKPHGDFGITTQKISTTSKYSINTGINSPYNTRSTPSFNRNFGSGSFH